MVAIFSIQYFPALLTNSFQCLFLPIDTSLVVWSIQGNAQEQYGMANTFHHTAEIGIALI
ncbi:hypothetical protein BOO23_19840 [Vibrio navarrensis]|nr:hypothetical protein [Vibrio navarrensis]